MTANKTFLLVFLVIVVITGLAATLDMLGWF